MLRSLFLLLILLALASCSDDSPSSPPDDEVITGFQVVRLEYDTLYWGEKCRLIGKDFGSNRESLKLFLRSLEVSFELLSDTLIEFTAPINAESGTLRLYKSDSAAKGTVTVTVLPANFNSIIVGLFGFLPLQGYEGEQLIIRGSGAQLRRRDIEVSVNDLFFPIDSISFDAIYTRIPTGITSGDLIVQVFGKDRNLGPFTALKHSGDFLESGSISNVAFEIFDILVELQRIDSSSSKRDTTITEAHGLSFTSIFGADKAQLLRKGDSIIYFDKTVWGSDTIWLEFRFKESVGKNELSGFIRSSYKQNLGGNIWKSEAREIRVNNILWRRENNRYILHQDKATLHPVVEMFDYRYEYSHPEYTTQLKVHRYLGAMSSTNFKIYFEI